MRDLGCAWGSTCKGDVGAASRKWGLVLDWELSESKGSFRDGPQSSFIKEVGVAKWDRVVIDEELTVPRVSPATQMFDPFVWWPSVPVCVSVYHSYEVIFSDIAIMWNSLCVAPSLLPGQLPESSWLLGVFYYCFVLFYFILIYWWESNKNFLISLRCLPHILPRRRSQLQHWDRGQMADGEKWICKRESMTISSSKADGKHL